MEFKKYKLEDVCLKITDGSHYSPKNDENSKIPMLSVKDMLAYDFDYKNCKHISEEEYNKMKKNDCVPKIGDVLVAKDGSYLKEIFVNKRDDKKAILSSIAIFRPNTNIILPEYLCYLLKSPKIYNYTRNNCVSGSALPRIILKSFKNIPIEITTIENQTKIVNFLSNLDKKIQLNSQINNNLYEMCNKIYHSYLDKYSNLIVYKKIVDIAKKVVTGKTPSTKNEDFWNGNIPFITIPDMHNQVFTIGTERSITESGAKAIIPKNSISVSCIATVGLVSISTKKSQTNQQINSIIIDNYYDLYYLFEFLSEQSDYMKNIAGGSTTYNINKNTFENIEVPYLPKEILIDFHNIVVNMFEKIKFNQKENITLQDLKDTLLPKLMNGEIDLDTIEI